MTITITLDVHRDPPTIRAGRLAALLAPYRVTWPALVRPLQQPA